MNDPKPPLTHYTPSHNVLEIILITLLIRILVRAINGLLMRRLNVAPFIATRHFSGVTSGVDCSYATRLERERFPRTLIELDGTEGSLRLGSNYLPTVASGSTTRHEDVSPPLLSWAERPWHNIQESVFNIEAHWAKCLREGTIRIRWAKTI